MHSCVCVSSVPTFGQFDKDGIPDIMIEEDIGNDTKRVSDQIGSNNNNINLR